MPKETKVLSYIGFRNIISHCVFGYISNQEGRRKFVYMYVQQSDGNSEAKQKPDPLAGQCLFAASWWKQKERHNKQFWNKNDYSVQFNWRTGGQVD